MSKVTLKDGKPISGAKPRERKMWWRYLLVWFGGFLSFALVTGIVAIVLTTSFTSKEVLTIFGVDVNSVLQPYYQGLSILQLATTLPTLKYETLGDIYRVTPMVKTIFEETINPVLEKELHFEYDWDVIATKPFKLPVEAREDGSVDVTEELSHYLGRAIKEGVYLADFFEEGLPTLVNLFLYPKDQYGNFDYEHPYCLMDFIEADADFFNNIMNGIKVKDFIENPTGDPLLEYIGDWSINDFDEDHINNLSIGLFIDPNTTDPLMQEISTWTVSDLKAGTKFNSLSLGLFLDSSSTDPFIQEISTWTVGDLKQGDVINNLSLGLFFDPNSEDPIILKLSELTVSDLKDDDAVKDLLMGLKLEEIVTIDSETPPLIVTLINKHYTIEQIISTNLFNDLTVGDVFDTSDNRLLQALSDVSLSGLEDENTILGLRLGDVLPTTPGGDSIIDRFADNTLSELSSLDIHDIKITDLFSSEEIYNNNNKFLKALVESNPDITIGDLTDTECIRGLKLVDILPYDQIVGSKIISALVELDCTFGEIASAVDTLTLGTVLGIDDNSLGVPQILMALKDTPINNLTNKINTLVLSEIIDIDVDDPDTPLFMKTIANKTINELNAYLPHIKLGDVMDFSSYPNLDNDDIKNTEINDFGNLINSLKNHLKVKDVVDIDPSDPNTPALLVTLADEFLKDLPTKLNSLKLNEIMNIDSSSHPLLQALANYSFSELDGVIPTLSLEDLLEIDDSSPLLLQALKAYSLSELESQIPNLTLSQLVSIDSSSPKVLQTLANTSIGDFATDITNLTLSQLVDIDTTDPDTPQILLALKDVKVLDGESLVNKINNLKLNDIYKASDCTGVFKYLWDENDNGDLAITQIPNAVNSLPLVKILEEYIYIDDVNQAKYYDAVDDAYYSYSQLIGGLSPSGHEVTEYKRIDPIYWFLLTEEGETFTSEEKHYVLKNGLNYTINSGLNNLTVNFAFHMQVEKLYELYDAGILDTSSITRTQLDTQFTYHGETYIVGNLTMSEFISICINILGSLPPIP